MRNAYCPKGTIRADNLSYLIGSVKHEILFALPHRTSRRANSRRLLRTTTGRPFWLAFVGKGHSFHRMAGRSRQGRTPNTFARALWAGLLGGLVLVSSPGSTAPRTEPLYPGLYRELAKINTGGYQKWPKNEAGKYFGRTDVPPEEYRALFSRFFSDHPQLSHGFSSYIGYAAFGWFSAAARTNTQRGLCPAVLEQVERYADRTPEALAAVLVREKESRAQNFRVFARLLGECARRDPKHNLCSDCPVNISAALRRLASRAPNRFGGGSRIEPGVFPYANSFRAIVHLVLAETDAARPDLAGELGLTGLRREIWSEHRVLVLDNEGLPDRQLTIIRQFLRHIPRDMHQLRGISVRSYLEQERYRDIEFRGAVNVFGAPPGRQAENSFPSDVAAVNSDQFSLVVAHEINHSVDHNYVSKHPKWRVWRNRLIREAGDKQTHYLRSTVAGGYFSKNPSEFFASLANQWFSSTANTLELGYRRCQRGNRHPMEQAVFFADVYSLSSSASKGFRLDDSGTLTPFSLRLERDTNGRIVSLSAPEATYRISYAGDRISGCVRDGGTARALAPGRAATGLVSEKKVALRTDSEKKMQRAQCR